MGSMHLPKIIFRETALEQNVKIVKWNYRETGGLMSLRDLTVRYFPELKNLDNNLSQAEVNQIIEDVVSKRYNENKNLISQNVRRYADVWKVHNDKYFAMLSDYLDIKWPKNINMIEATVGMLPAVYPRYLDKSAFSITIGIEDRRLISICAHEALHFLWFEKWKQIYPETPRVEYDSPYAVWQYSEMIIDPILNSQTFSEVFNFNERGYDYFYKILDGEIRVMDNLR